MTKQRMELRYRALRTMYHPQCDCYIEPGEDFNMEARQRNAEEKKYYLDNGILTTYTAPVGTPHVVHQIGTTHEWVVEANEWRDMPVFSSAAKQWAGETTFIAQYIPNETVEVPQVKE